MSGLRSWRNPNAGETLESSGSERGCADFERGSTLFRARGGPIESCYEGKMDKWITSSTTLEAQARACVQFNACFC